jgi:hypothetical protein
MDVEACATTYGREKNTTQKNYLIKKELDK